MKSEKKEEHKKSNNNDNKLLKIVFYLLIILVIILSITAYITQKNNPKTNYTIPLEEDNLKSSILVDLSSLKNDDTKKYTFSIINMNQQKKINQKNIEYEIEIIPSKNIKTTTKLTYLNNSKNLLKNNKVDKLILKKKQKNKVNYELNIKLNKKNEDKKSFIIIQITGKIRK